MQRNEFHYAPCGMPCAGKRLAKTIRDAYFTSGGAHTLHFCTVCGPMPTPFADFLNLPESRARVKLALREWALYRLRKGLTSFPTFDPQRKRWA
jgi:hypothetical protein